MKQSYVSPSMLALHKKNRKINSSTTMCLKLATMLNPSLPVQNKLGWAKIFQLERQVIAMLEEEK